MGDINFIGIFLTAAAKGLGNCKAVTRALINSAVAKMNRKVVMVREEREEKEMLFLCN
jgi:hypothetical protein